MHDPNKLIIGYCMEELSLVFQTISSEVLEKYLPSLWDTLNGSET